MFLTLFNITILLFITYSGLIIFYRLGWVKAPEFHVTLTGKPPSTKITIIIPARNEAKNIQDCLYSVIAQSYPKELFEVVVIDDYSTDHTAAIVRSFSDKNVKLLSLKDHIVEGQLIAYKKKAIELAIEQATGDLIVTTDADCIVKKHWLRTIALYYEKYNPAFIAAPVVYSRSSSNENFGTRFLKIFQALDFMSLQGITGASVHQKIHSMCNGANLAYEKKAFNAVGGFKGIDTIASGDDMLLMYKIYRVYPERIMFLKSTDTIVETKPVESVKEFLNQRIRWASKANKYDDKRIFGVLLFVYIFNVWLGALLFFGLGIGDIELLFVGAVIAKTIIELFFLYPVADFFSRKKLLWWFLPAQPFHILYTITAGWLGRFGSYEWKERRVH
jgi:cellulose synthase/poly-beta-1,6-N-acetylglucosamine synthase-like glycosyltransferase